MSQPTFDLTPLGKNTTNRTTSPIDSIPVGAKIPSAYATDTTNRTVRAKCKSARTRRTGSRPITVRLIIKKSNSSKDSNSSKSIKEKIDKKKKRCKQNKNYASDSLSSDSDLSDNNDYRRKQRKKKSHRKKDSIKLCARLTVKLLKIAYKSKIVRFKMD